MDQNPTEPTFGWLKMCLAIQGYQWNYQRVLGFITQSNWKPLMTWLG